MKDFVLNQFTRATKFLYLFQLKRHQWLNADEVKKLQEKKLKKMIVHAYMNIPFYTELFKSANIIPSDIQHAQDLKKIPIITKEDVRKNYPDRIIAKGTNLKKCHIAKTTGSSGTPLEICFGYADRNFFYALINYAFFESGVNWFDKIITIRHESETRQRSWKTKLNFWKPQRKNISIFDPLTTIVDELNNSKPDVIYTYPSVLTLLEKEILGTKELSFRPKVIWTVGETLSNASRASLSKVFNSEIFRLYATEEFGPLAFECKKHNGYHIITNNAVVEIVNEDKDAKPGEKGEIIVTSLANKIMPLIRYRLGDIGIAAPSECGCGRNLPLIERIEGREDDFIVLPSGRKISPRMINVMEDIEGIKEYQTIQEAKDRITVKVVKNSKFSEQTITRIKQQIEIGCLNEKIQINVKLVDQIQRQRTGKRRAIVSLVK
jgi:phenylacetate-CoA ligase